MRQKSNEWLQSGRDHIGWLISIAVTLAAIVVAVMSWGGSGSSDNEPSNGAGASESPHQTPSEEEPSGAVAKSDPLELDGSVEELNMRIGEFVPLYFSKEPDLTEAEHKERVEDYATAEFLADYDFGLSGPGDEALVKENASIEADLYGDLRPGELFPDGTAAVVEPTIQVTKYDADSDEVWSETFDLKMTWVKTSEGWKIFSFD